MLTQPLTQQRPKPMSSILAIKLNFPDLRLSDSERQEEISSYHLLTALVNRRGTLIHVLFPGESEGTFLRIRISRNACFRKLSSSGQRNWVLIRLKPWWKSLYLG